MIGIIPNPKKKFQIEKKIEDVQSAVEGIVLFDTKYKLLKTIIMKKIIYYLTTMLLFTAQTAFSQMNDGQYTFANNEVTLELTITGNGWTISSATLTNKTTKKISTGKGEYRHANNVASGINLIEWYEFQTTDCNYDFDIPTDKLALSQFDCKNGQQTVKFNLSKKVADWTGTYKNSDSATSNKTPTVVPDFTKSFEGTINSKYRIIMTLTKNANNLNGTYTYKSQGTPIKISGTTDDNGNLTINEFNDKGNMTGIFKGQLSGNNIIGQWTKPDGSKTMPFSISESTNGETTIAKTELNNADDYSNWTGTYVDEFKRRILKITGPASDGAVKFELTPQNSASCQEDVWVGTAYLTNSAVANYTEEGSECHFNFTFNSGQIEVHEYDCSHGASCGTFDGFYTKKK